MQCSYGFRMAAPYLIVRSWAAVRTAGGRRAEEVVVVRPGGRGETGNSQTDDVER